MTDRTMITFGNLALKHEPADTRFEVIDGRPSPVMSRPRAASAPDVCAHRAAAPLYSEKTLPMILLASAAAALCLVVSISTATPAPVFEATHEVVVQPGDSLWSIASEFASDPSEVNTIIQTMREMNGLTSGTLYPGMNLTVPSH